MDTRTFAQQQTGSAISWKIAAKLPVLPGATKQLGVAGPYAGVNHDVLLVAGGANFPDSMPWLGGKKKYYGDIYVFEKNKETINPYPILFHLPYSVAYGASVSTPQGIVCAGGENETGMLKKAFLLKWDVMKKTVIIKPLPDLPIPLTNASITVDEQVVYLAGGEITSGVSNHFYSLDLNQIAAGWKQLPPLPQPTSHAVMLVQSDGKDKGIYIIGGRKRNSNGISDLYASVYRFDLKTNQWTEKNSLPYALSAGTGVAADSHFVLLFGGDRGETFHKTEELIEAINAVKDEAKKQQLIQDKAVLQASHTGFSHEVLKYNTCTDEWKTIGTIPFDVPATTTAVLWGNEVVIPSGEIRAGVRTANILAGKLPISILSKEN